MRSLNAQEFQSAPNFAYPFLGSNRAGYLGATGLANPWLLKVAPDTKLWQDQVTQRNFDSRYGIVATVGMAGVSEGVAKTGTFVDLSEFSRFGQGSWRRTNPRAAYPMRPIVLGNQYARTNPTQQWYMGGYTSSLPAMSDQLSAMLNKGSNGGYAG
jgi:hypothetical protein